MKKEALWSIIFEAKCHIVTLPTENPLLTLLTFIFGVSYLKKKSVCEITWHWNHSEVNIMFDYLNNKMPKSNKWLAAYLDPNLMP